MFKVPKRKKPIVKKLRSSDDSDNDTEDVTHERDDVSKATTNPAATKPKTKNKNRNFVSKTALGAGLSFNIDEGDDVELHASRKKRRKGLGFGGIQVLNDFENDQTTIEPTQQEHQQQQEKDWGSGPTDASKISSGYSKEDLQKLKSQQKVYLEENTNGLQVKDTMNENDPSVHFVQPSVPAVSSVPIPPTPSDTFPSKPIVPEEDFISLHSSTKKDDYVIVSGDDALQFVTEQEDVQTEFQGINQCFDGEDNQDGTQEMDVEGEKWEEEIIKRAGIGGSFAEKTLGDSKQSYKAEHSFKKEDGRRAIEDIKHTIEYTLQNLDQQELELETNIMRKNHDASTAEDDALEKEKELSSTGKAFEYYQNLRSDIAAWTGALRHLSEKVDVIESALEELYQDLGRRRVVQMQEWQDDVATELKEKNWLDYAVGRQPIIATETQGDVHMVDEFGRDVKSMESLARSKRKNARKKRRSESEDRRKGTYDQQNQLQIEYEDTDVDVSDHELMERVERRSALGDAIDIVLEDVDDEFRSISVLLSLFCQWEKSEPKDYMQCYATLSLMSYISVFARAEFCKKLDLLDLGVENNSYELKDFEWFTSLKSSNAFPQNSIIGKTCVIQLRMSLFGTKDLKGLCWSYDPFSTRQTRRLSNFFRSTIVPNMPIDDTNALLDDVCEYINRYLQEMSFLILKKGDSYPNDDDDSLDALNFASLGQIYRIKKLVSNIINYWYPLGNRKRFATLCLTDVLSFRFLPIFEALGPQSANFEQASNVFHSLWKSLTVSGLLGDDDLMLSSSAIRAAASKLGFTLT